MNTPMAMAASQQLELIFSHTSLLLCSRPRSPDSPEAPSVPLPFGSLLQHPPLPLLPPPNRATAIRQQQQQLLLLLCGCSLTHRPSSISSLEPLHPKTAAPLRLSSPSQSSLSNTATLRPPSLLMCSRRSTSSPAALLAHSRPHILSISPSALPRLHAAAANPPPLRPPPLLEFLGPRRAPFSSRASPSRPLMPSQP